MKRLRDLLNLVAVGLVAAAVYQELQKPPEQRTWHGRLFGVIPYDFRVPTLETLREAYWNPSNPSVFSDRVLGVGWGINFYRLWQDLRAMLAQPSS